jgi:adenylate kinase
MKQTINLPRVIILYGPPGSGKGTQANLLVEQFGLKFIDWGHSFRTFAAEFKDQEGHPDQWRGQRVQEHLDRGEPIVTEDMRYILEKQILEVTTNPELHLIMDKPGSLPEEAEWISGFLKEKEISSCLIHLPLSEEQAISRVSHRYYLPGNSQPFASYEEAKKVAPQGVEPFIRQDDLDVQTIRNRWEKVYGKYRDQILELYRSKKWTRMFEVDASQTVEVVNEKIVEFLKSL